MAAVVASFIYEAAPSNYHVPSSGQTVVVL